MNETKSYNNLSSRACKQVGLGPNYGIPSLLHQMGWMKLIVVHMSFLFEEGLGSQLKANKLLLTKS